MADENRIDSLVSEFDGAIKYQPMLTDHPDWTDEQCLAFAREWHTVAIANLKEALNKDYETGHWHNPPSGDFMWNNKIPYCRNLPTETMLKEALA